MEIGRNDPCPCGSGKKYKKCCLNKDNSTIDLLYYRITDTYNKLLDKIVSFAEKEYGPEVFKAGIDEFFLWEEPEYINEVIEEFYGVFIPWFVFNWSYDPDEIPYELDIPPYVNIAELYRRHIRNIDSLEIQLIDGVLNQPYCFYEVISSTPGENLTLRNILSGEKLKIIEKAGSQNARPGDIIFANIINIKNMNMMMACWKYLIPIGRKPMIIELRRNISKLRREVTKELITEYQLEIRELLFDIYDTFVSPPVMQNTDGDPVIFHKIHYHIKDPNEAFNRLCDLCSSESPDELIKEATLDQQGNIIKIEFPWTSKGNKSHKNMDNTILGFISIDKNRMTIEVNSENRAKRARAEVESRLKNSASYRTTEITSFESLMKNSSEKIKTNVRGHEDIIKLPEVRKEMEKFFANHWKDWINEKIPALGGKSPKQAVKTPDGRESVEALLKDAENSLKDDKEFGSFQINCIKEVRTKLGLDRPFDEVFRDIKESEKRAGKNISEMIKRFGKKYLDSTHTLLAIKLCKRIGEHPELFLSRGRPEIWASAIIYTISQINFLFDDSIEPFISPDDILNFFNTKKSTVSSKALLIRKMLDIYYGDKEFCSKKIIDIFDIDLTEDGFIIPKGGLLKDETDETSAPEDKKEEEKYLKNQDTNQLPLFDDE